MRWCAFVKQKTAYEITYGDWSSDVCSSDLERVDLLLIGGDHLGLLPLGLDPNQRPLRTRSEERRVGKECRSRWSPDHSTETPRRGDEGESNACPAATTRRCCLPAGPT